MFQHPEQTYKRFSLNSLHFCSYERNYAPLSTLCTNTHNTVDVVDMMATAKSNENKRERKEKFYFHAMELNVVVVIIKTRPCTGLLSFASCNFRNGNFSHSDLHKIISLIRMLLQLTHKYVVRIFGVIANAFGQFSVFCVALTLFFPFTYSTDACRVGFILLSLFLSLSVSLHSNPARSLLLSVRSLYFLTN